MAAIQWGRKETIIFPPHNPIYSYGAAFLALVLTGFFVYLRFSFGQLPLQQYYTPIYVRAAAGGAVNKTDKFQLLYVGDGTKASRLATEGDVQEGTTPVPGGKEIPLALSPAAKAQGYRFLIRGAPLQYKDALLHGYLKNAVYNRDEFWEIYKLPLLFGLLSLLLQLPFSVRKDVKRRKQMRYGRRLKGPERLTPKEFNRKVRGDGIGIKTDGLTELVRIPAKAEAQHVQIIADTGAGKTTLIMQILRQIRGRGDSAIVYDPALEYTRRFYDPRHDIILDEVEGTIQMPRFKLDYRAQLERALKILGMECAFDPKQAEFDGVRARQLPVWIDQVFHRAVAEGNEEGTEAAAVTMATVWLSASIKRPPRHFEMIIDRPFFVAIRDKTMETILFMGWVGDPGRVALS